MKDPFILTTGSYYSIPNAGRHYLNLNQDYVVLETEKDIYFAEVYNSTINYVRILAHINNPGKRMVRRSYHIWVNTEDMTYRIDGKIPKHHIPFIEKLVCPELVSLLMADKLTMSYIEALR